MTQNSPIHVGEDYMVLFEHKFRKVYQEIDYLRSKVHLQEGLWIFSYHVYSQEDLLNSEHHKRIHSITGKIGDDVRTWHEQGMLSPEEEKAYYYSKIKVDDLLHSLNMEIMTRKPTLWESCRSIFINFKDIIMGNLPNLIRLLIPSPIGKKLFDYSMKHLQVGNLIKYLT